MKIEYVGDGYEVEEKMKTLIAKKLKKLDKYFEPQTLCKLSLRQEKTSYVMVANIFAAPAIRAEAESTNMYDNIDLIIPKITRQLRKEQTKVQKARAGTIPKILFNNDLKDAQSAEE